MTIKITSIEDVKAFANHLANDLHLNFHPDDDFSFYVNYETKEPTFSPEEAAKYNALMKVVNAEIFKSLASTCNGFEY